MTKTIRANDWLEFKQEAEVSTAKTLGLVEQTLFNWARRAGKASSRPKAGR